VAIEFGSKQSTPETQLVSVPALVQKVDSSTIRDYLALSEKLPIVLLFIQAGEPASQVLVQSVTSLIEKANGALIGLVVDVSASPELAQAFELQQVPSAFGLLKGQPAPLFVGNQPIEQIQLVLNKVLEVAKENGLNARASVSAESADTEPELSPTMQAAYEAIDQGKYSEALSLYEKALLENPNDSLAEAGMAQVKLLLRLQGKNISELSTTEATDEAELLDKADALIATGMAEVGFALLLELFEKTPKDKREQIRSRLVELFLVVGSDNPAVVSARKTLSLLLF
jgi:putative thioredoxin